MTDTQKLEAIKAEIQRKIARIDDTIAPENEQEQTVCLGVLMSIRNFIKSLDEQSDNCGTTNNTDITKSNAEKAKDLTLSLFAKNFIYFNSISQRKAVEKTLVMMADWKDEQFKAEEQALIDKACEWLNDNAPDYDLVTYDRFLSWLKSLKDRVQSQPKEDIDKPDWVDLGLPSGTLWKSQNETNPNDDNDFYTFDEALQKFGSQLPTKEQWEELKENCDWIYGSNGCECKIKVIGKNGNSIFLHAVGYHGLSGDVKYRGIWGYYWSSVPYDSEDAWYFFSDSVGMGVNWRSKCYGLSVRLVKE